MTFELPSGTLRSKTLLAPHESTENISRGTGFNFFFPVKIEIAPAKELMASHAINLKFNCMFPWISDIPSDNLWNWQCFRLDECDSCGRCSNYSVQQKPSLIRSNRLIYLIILKMKISVYEFSHNYYMQYKNLKHTSMYQIVPCRVKYTKELS